MKKIKTLIITTALAVVLTNVNLAEGLKKADSFSLKDYNGKTHSLLDYKNSSAIVLIYVSTQCPVSNAYNERMADLYESYKGKNVSFIGINSNKAEDIEEIKKHAAENNLQFTVLKDINNVIADKFAASFTPEVYVLNDKQEIVYHGRIDDNRRKENVQVSDLSDALDEILAGKKVTNPKTKAFGCTIKRVGK
ncbi:MAG: alkyl hydroperoxide reductase/Thiol specific antioxidant/Mal allergen [Ignavibacteria bacterium]|nr:MAG: alkyl hydroperoxide reductase/Thiol specific antioxidant/Mal allergen [Ignavibacteria bacterium]KAF0161533.1 MAG: alkyl hydroperoxide reductase/Thiol specific antioxidant/Mal allergen [Ignavibacteria bacterium]